MKRLVFALCGLAMLSGCGALKLGKDDPTTPTLGNRISVLSGEADIAVDPELASVTIALPAPVATRDWAQPGGNAAKNPGHVAIGDTLARAWSIDIGAGSTTKARLAAAPVVANGVVYTIDTASTVRALSAANGGQIWEAQVRGEGGAVSLFGGGVSYDNGRVYVTNGLGYAAALDAQTGAAIWQVRPGGPLRGAPTIANDNVYVVSQDNQLYTLNPADGALRWTGTGTVELAGVFGVGAPAAAQGTVVAGFSSGELTAYRYENGRVVWQDALARTAISTAVSSLSDIDAEPVIDNGRVYAVGQGGRMVAVELVTGQRVWEINVAGIATPAVAGDWIFVVTDEAQLLAVARATGKIKWMTQLPRWRDEKDRQGPISWVGPVLAGNRLILASSQGQVAYVSPFDGTVQARVDSGGAISLPPVVADGTLYLLSDDGRLTAWR